VVFKFNLYHTRLPPPLCVHTSHRIYTYLRIESRAGRQVQLRPFASSRGEVNGSYTRFFSNSCKRHKNKRHHHGSFCLLNTTKASRLRVHAKAPIHHVGSLRSRFLFISQHSRRRYQHQTNLDTNVSRTRSSFIAQQGALARTMEIHGRRYIGPSWAD